MEKLKPMRESERIGNRNIRETDKATQTRTSSGSAGAFGYLSVSAPPILPENTDIDTIGMSFQVVEPEKEVEAEPIELEDIRTNEDIKREARAFIANALDLPENIIADCKASLQKSTDELRDFVMSSIVPVLLAVDPALQSVKQMVPKLFDDGGDSVEVDLPIESLKSYAYSTSLLAARIKIVDMLGLGDDVKHRLLMRLLPEDKKSS